MRKIIIYASIAVLVVGAAYFLAQSQSTLPEPKKKEEAIQEKGPLADWVIGVDPGHGGYDGGARSRQMKVWEKHINLQVAKKLASVLEREGATVIMTRNRDEALASRKRPDLDARLQLVQEGKGDMLLSIHMNQYHSERESGPQVFYRKNHPESQALAQMLQSQLIQDLQPKKERSAMAGDYYMLQMDIPSVLIECGFISNMAEEELLLREEYQLQLAEAICRAVCSYANNQKENRASSM